MDFVARHLEVGPWKKRACRGPATITRLPAYLLTNSSTISSYYNHTMSAVTSQSLSTALTVISANIEGLTAAKTFHTIRDVQERVLSFPVSPRNTPIHQSLKAKDSWNVASS